MACHLRRLAAETRLQIFGSLPSLVSEPWDGRMPAIIKALRADSELQQEAMSVFAKHQVYVLHVGNSWSFQDMLSTAMLTIKNVRIIIDVEIKPRKGMEWNGRKMFEPAGSMCLTLQDLQASACRLRNVKSLDIEFNTALPSWVFERRARGMGELWQDTFVNAFSLHYYVHHAYFRPAAWFKRLERFSVILPPKPSDQYGDGTYGDLLLNDLYNDRVICDVIEAGNAFLGVSAKLGRVTEITSWIKDMDQYVWFAEKDKYLAKQI